ATAIAGVVGGPISGKILEQLGGVGGLAGWQWLFLLEGLPAVGFGLVALGYLTDRPADADWLAPAERAWLSERMRREHAERAERRGYSLIQALVHGRVWLPALPYFGLVKEHTDGFAGGLAVLAGWLVLAGVIALGLRDEAAPPT